MVRNFSGLLCSIVDGRKGELENLVTTFRIHDSHNMFLTVELQGLLEQLAPRSLECVWRISTVRSSKTGGEWFEATGPASERLDAMAHANAVIDGMALSKLGREIRQVIWGEFTGMSPSSTDPWIVIRAIDSSFYEVTTQDEEVIAMIAARYKDVGIAAVPWS